MKIVSWNILQGGGSRSPDIVATLKQLEADVLAVQEFRHGNSKPVLLQGFDELGYESRLLPEPESLATGAPSGKTLNTVGLVSHCLLYTSPSPRDRQKSRMPSSA